MFIDSNLIFYSTNKLSVGIRSRMKNNMSFDDVRKPRPRKLSKPTTKNKCI